MGSAWDPECGPLPLADLTLMHFGTSLWDARAPEAILVAQGGKVTDLFGSPLLYSCHGSSTLNSLGVVASKSGRVTEHDGVCAAMRSTPCALGLLTPWAGADLTVAGTGAGTGAGEGGVDVVRSDGAQAVDVA